MAMKREINPVTLSAISDSSFYNVWLVYLDWPSGAIRAHSGVGVINFQGQSWIGVGRFGTITLPSEGFGIASFPAEIEIHGLPSEVADFLDAPIRNRSVEIYGAVVTERAGNVVVGSPFELWQGYMDALSFKAALDEENGQSSLTYSILLQARGGPTARTAAEIYHTAEDQSSKFPGDTAGRLTINAEAEGAKLTWPES